MEARKWGSYKWGTGLALVTGNFIIIVHQKAMPKRMLMTPGPLFGKEPVAAPPAFDDGPHFCTMKHSLCTPEHSPKSMEPNVGTTAGFAYP